MDCAREYKRYGSGNDRKLERIESLFIRRFVNHMKIKHPLDSPSGLTCYTCNKMFTQRDLIENHFKTFKHQLECIKLQNLGNKKILAKRNDFQAKAYQPRTWNSEATVESPWGSTIHLQDPRKKAPKHSLDMQIEEELEKKTETHRRKPNHCS